MTPILITLLLLSLAQIQALAQGPGGSDIQTGKEIWQGYFNLENDCKLCHGVQGEGGFAKPRGPSTNHRGIYRRRAQGPGTDAGLCARQESQ